MGRRGRRRQEQEQLAAVPPDPVWPIETWSVEEPFSPREMMPREIVYVGDDGQVSDADSEE